nr:ClpX C4-type zinc finger protein [uncultured Campylobacter sp.]
MYKDETKQVRCSFCGKSQEQVKKIIAGPDVFICNECVDLCKEIIDEEFSSMTMDEMIEVLKPQEILKVLSNLVGGKYKVTDIGILFQPKKSRKGYNIEIASSSVRSLLMLNFYILNTASKKDILMIDEPELNLHPNNQILVARLLVLLANAGIKVFITTHSDYIVREISNCIMLGSLTDNQIDKFKNKGYTKEYKINHQKVKAYLAENKKGKNILSSVDINEQGIFMNTFDSPIDTQNENQSLIFAALLESNKNDK